MINLDEKAADEFRARLAEARAHLARLMAEHGLEESAGWRIHEIVRGVPGGLEMVLRPIHSRLPSPPGVECVVRIEERSQEVDLTCEPGRA